MCIAEIKNKSNHAYEVQVSQNGDYIRVDANNRVLAASKVKKMGYKVWSVSMVG
jgi:hypothetical protein